MEQIRQISGNTLSKALLESKYIPYEYRDITKEKEHEREVNEFVVKLKWSTSPMIYIQQSLLVDTQIQQIRLEGRIRKTNKMRIGI
ncbi:unnamed protein product (macronuclear) [Paramecium tetraurelia]|uniref:Glutaredoxin domain-containing protein n=1 Tax=Paramecium tetraurelia TaxID=5888 RepID=A0C870_PARTE|nr:uncharacterized protein GSPATT00036118001 [Paramecium tetraurelia]CAK66987.1 unnamed protein product [Paramecium tetraurelia]|eukprot:XP_001434384.1 hypothetical protein (macronuclear) [Paramecium tetraurelia strain d4-2]